MARTTNDEVKKIIDTDLTPEQVNPFLNAAEVLVTDLLSGENYGSDLLTEIVKWLAAHFVAIRDPRVAKEKFGDADATFQGKTGLGLQHTSYGQQVMILEHHGVLAQVSSAKVSASLKVITP